MTDGVTSKYLDLNKLQFVVENMKDYVHQEGTILREDILNQINYQVPAISSSIVYDLRERVKEINNQEDK